MTTLFHKKINALKPAREPHCKGYARDRFEHERLYLYAFRCAEFVKIGISKHIATRLQGVRTSNPFDVMCETYRTVPVGKAAQIEFIVHTLLMPLHHRGEWFKCDKETVRTAFYRAILEGRKLKANEKSVKKLKDNLVEAILKAKGEDVEPTELPEFFDVPQMGHSPVEA